MENKSVISRPPVPVDDASRRLQLVSELQNRFTYHPPKQDQVLRYGRIRQEALEFAGHLVESCPPSRELSVALTRLDEVVMFANAAIARNE